jgi:hypothetical protein
VVASSPHGVQHREWILHEQPDVSAAYTGGDSTVSVNEFNPIEPDGATGPQFGLEE